MPIGDFAGGFAEGFSSASAEERMRKAQKLQEEIADRQHKLQLRAVDFQVADWMLKTLQSDIDKPARQFLLKQGAINLLGLDPKTEAYKDFEKLLLSSSPDNLQTYREIVSGAFPDMQPGQVQAFAKAFAMGKVDLMDMFNMQKPGDIETNVVANPESQTGFSYEEKGASVGQAAPAPRAQTEIRMPADESAFLKGVGEDDAAEVKRIREGAATARQILPAIRTFRAAIDAKQFIPGTAAGIRETLSRAAEFVGMSPKELGLGPAADAEVMQAAGRQLALTLTENVSRVTNMSLQFVIDAGPTIFRTPAGNKAILELMEISADRAIKLDRLKNEYINKYQSLRNVPEGVPTFFEAQDSLIASYEEQDNELQGRLKSAIAEGAGLDWKNIPGISAGGGQRALRNRLEQLAKQHRYVFQNPTTGKIAVSEDGQNWTIIDDE